MTVEVPGRRLLTEVAFEVDRGESVAIVGPSGSGKSTLLNVVAGILPAAAGSVHLAGHDLLAMHGAERARFRLEHIGIVFQFGEILPEFSVIENVALPLRFRDIGRQAATERARAALASVNMDTHASSRPEDLSGGERQRVAVARALAGAPDVIIADEPTGSLDRSNADVVCQLLIDRSRIHGTALLVATHDPLVASSCDTVLELADGSLGLSGGASC